MTHSQAPILSTAFAISTDTPQMSSRIRPRGSASLIFTFIRELSADFTMSTCGKPFKDCIYDFNK